MPYRRHSSSDRGQSADEQQSPSSRNLSCFRHQQKHSAFALASALSGTRACSGKWRVYVAKREARWVPEHSALASGPSPGCCSVDRQLLVVHGNSPRASPPINLFSKVLLTREAARWCHVRSLHDGRSATTERELSATCPQIWSHRRRTR